MSSSFSAHPPRHRSLGLPPIPRTQALTSTTFHPPPLDGTLAIPELWDWHYDHSPQHPLFIYSDDEGTSTTITWREACRAIHQAGHIAQRLARQDPSCDRPVFAILAGNDAITYFTLMAGIMRAGYRAFPVSPRNSPAAVAHLLNKTEVAHIFVGPEPALQTLASSAFKLIDEAGTRPPTLSQVPSFDELYMKDSSQDFERLPPLEIKWDDPLLTLHSSGSTAFPKPIIFTHERLLLSCLAPWFGQRDLTGQRLACHAMPMFHGMGVMQIGWTAFSGLVLTVFKPRMPPVAPNPESVMKGVMDTRSDYIFCVPSFVEAWASNPAHVERLKGIEGIIYGGGPLSQAVGNELTEKGVTIFVMYGNSECGINNVILPKTVGKDWQYFAFPDNVKPHFLYDSEGNAELVLLTHQLQKPCVTNTTVNGVPAYATSDIMSPHPTKPGFWKVYGRADDQIMHNTGEKTNPGPLENILNQDPHIQAAVMFGRGRFNAGVLIDPKSDFKFDPTEKDKLADFRNLIWPTVEKLNAYAPQHSRVFKEMIIVSSPGKPFMYTAKNTARRQAIISDYEREIDELYEAVEETAQAELDPPTAWDLGSVTSYIRAVISRVLKNPVEDDDDIFLKGCDSLQATWIRNTVLHLLKDNAKVNVRAIPNSFVYQHPSIISLASFVTNVANEGSISNTPGVVKQMLAMVDKYTTGFPQHQPSGVVEKPEQDTIILTGTTGALGATLLTELVTLPEVRRIYALNRKGTKPLIDRHWQIFKERGLDVGALDSPKVVLLESNMDEENLGLSADIIREMHQSVTHILHNAWPVNFNMSLASFEPNVRSVRRLIDFALTSPQQSPPRLIFASSVGVLRNSDTAELAKEMPIPASVAVGSGYGESKWVAENILAVTARDTPLRPICIRIGQLSGGASGAWSQAEWLPSLVRSSVTLKVLPTIDNDISLLPADTAARALLELRNAEDLFLHLAHPTPTAWSTLIDPIAERLNLRMVPFDEWLTTLRRSGEGLDESSQMRALMTNPALKLLDFFAQGPGDRGSGGIFGIQTMDTFTAQKNSKTLREAAPLTKTIVLRWISYWQSADVL